MKTGKAYLLAIGVFASVFLGLCLLAYQAGSYRTAVKVGDTAPIPKTSSLYDMVGVRSAGNGPDLPPPEFCLFVQGATVTVLAVADRHVLASYAETGKAERECPNGTLFVHPTILFRDMERDHREQVASDDDRRGLLRRAERER
jgi:hypothetical protein